jgi:hypothetical protein
MSSHKKAMMVGEIFVYIVSLIVVAMVLIYGYSVINGFMGEKSNIELLQFQKNLEKYVKSYSSEFGSKGHKTLMAPGDAGYLCFVNYYSVSDSIMNCNGSIGGGFLFIKYSFQNSPVPREYKNMWLVDKRGEMMKSAYLGNITTAPKSGIVALGCNYLCVESYNGQFYLNLLGKGIGVEISDGTP